GEGEDAAAVEGEGEEALGAAAPVTSPAASGQQADPCAQPLQPAEAIDGAALELPSNVSFGPGYAGCALVAEYVGHPAALPLVRDMLRSFAAAHGYEIHSRAFEEYLSPMEEMELGDAHFQVYWPVVHPNNPPPPPVVEPEAPAEAEAAEAAEGGEGGGQ